jgi:hypothetical protein
MNIMWRKNGTLRSETLYYLVTSKNVFRIYMGEVKQVYVLVECRVGSMQAS